MFIKKIFKDVKKIKIIRNYTSKYISYTWKYAGINKKTQRMCHVIHIFFVSFLGKV